MLLRILLSTWIISLVLNAPLAACEKPEADGLSPCCRTLYRVEGEESPRFRNPKIPSREHRERIFDCVGIQERIAKFDELDRDLLFMRAASQEKGEVRKFLRELEGVYGPACRLSDRDLSLLALLSRAYYALLAQGKIKEWP